MERKNRVFTAWRGVVVFCLLGLLGVGLPSTVSGAAVSSLPPQVLELLQQQGAGAAAGGAGATAPPTVPIGKTTDIENKPAQVDTPAPDQKPNESPALSADQVKPAPPAETKPASSVESLYRNRYGSSLGDKLTQFGYEIFANAQVKTSRLATPTDDYRIGPGDKLRIRVWGSGVDSEYVGVVEKNGTINVPQIGIVDIADVTYGQVEQVIRKESEKYIQGSNVKVSLVDLRSVEVYVVGSVSSPSLHLVPAFSTVFDGVLAAGGVNKAGSLRNIELYRQGKLFKRFDLYELLLHGKRDADLVLENRDVIFVPRLGGTVAVAGAVGEAAIFELNGEKTVADCLALAGGLLPQGFAGRLHLRRYLNNQEFVVKDLDTEKDPKAASAMSIQNGDLIELAFVPEKMPQVVNLEGQVWQPDVFQLKPGMTIADVLTSNRVLKPGAVTDFAILRRYDAATARFTPQRIPLADVFSGKLSLPLQPYDRIEILSRTDIGITENITITGAVWKPGDKPFSPGLTLDGAMALAGGSRFGALLSSVEVSRQVITNGEAVTTIFNLDYGKDSSFVLQPQDFILVKQVKSANIIQTVHVTGEVRFPGDYKLMEGERLSSLIQRAGGFLSSAYFYGAKFTSERARAVQQKSISDMVERLEMQSKQEMVLKTQSSSASDAEALAQAALQKTLAALKSIKAEGRVAIQLADLPTFTGSDYDFILEAEDTLVVPRQPNFITVTGSVYTPNSFHYEPNRTVDEYLAKSGGLTKEADDDSVYILKANGEVVSKRQKNSLLSFSRLSSQVLMPGDTIVVPMDFEQLSSLNMVKDISDIVFKIATTAGIAIAALP